MLLHRSLAHFVGTVLLLCFTAAARADDAGTAKLLAKKGAKFTETKGVITGVDLSDLSKWIDDDFNQLATLSHLQKLSFGAGLTNHQLSLLVHLPEVSAFTTNGAQLDDDGVRQLVNFKGLTVLTFFHPGSKFTGVGLADLAALPKLEGLTVAGSSAFGNDGLVAIGQLSHLKGLRSWHCNISLKGLAALKDLKDLRSITISFNPPAPLADEAVNILASIKSLESVTLMESRISRAGLSPLKELPALTRLTLDGIDFPEADVAALKAELPKAQVKWTAPNPAAIKRIQATFEKK